MRMCAGGLEITGTDRNLKLRYDKDGDGYFEYRGKKQLLSTFEKIDSAELKSLGFIGYRENTCFWGLLIKIIDASTIRCYEYQVQ